MEYETGQTGRVIVLRLSDGDPVYKSVEDVARNEGISAATVWIVGGIKNGGVVVGPKVENVFPLQTLERAFSDAREIVGFGTVFANEYNEPKLHLHAAIGKGGEVIVGCPRIGADCWLINEIVMLEITGLSARRKKDAASGLELLTLGTEKKF